MKTYLNLIEFILKNGEKRTDRTGTGTQSIFGYQMRFDLRDGFPLITTKKTIFSSVLYELLWFIKGETNVNNGLKPHTKIWDPWARENGDLGPIYGYQWRHWERFTLNPKTKVYEKEHVDQLANTIHLIKTNPQSRRIIISAWNVADLDKMALPPCHAFFQFYVAGDYLDLQLYQRSADAALGVPFNIASYSLLLMMMAQECNLIPRYFVHTFGDAHIYLNHIEGLEEQIKRPCRALPQVTIAKKPFFELRFEDFALSNYDPHPFIKFPIAV